MERKPQTRFSLQQYLAMEALQETRSEYFYGEIYAMAGGTINHARLIGNVCFALRSRLQGSGCEVFSETLKVAHAVEDFSAYPDVMVVCGPLLPLEAKNPTSITNPQVVVEVLSDGTADFDRGGKFRAYRKLESLTEYVLVYQERRVVEVYRKQQDQWAFPEYLTSGHVTIAGQNIPLDEIYQGVDVPTDS